MAPAERGRLAECSGILGTTVLEDGGGAPIAVRTLLSISFNASRSIVLGGGGGCICCAGADEEGFLSPWVLNMVVRAFF